MVARRVLPTVRATVAAELSKRGASEREVAEKLAVTQSAVSKYLRGKTKLDPAVVQSPTFRQLARRLADGLADGSVAAPEALALTQAAVRKEERRGVVCALHEEELPALRGLGCDLCVAAGPSDFLQEQEALADARAALRLLERDRHFARLIPNVGTNLARARQGAKTPLEVAAVPGRIFEMHGHARVPAAPEFGASQHVAEVVLAALQVFPSLAAALNVRADPATLKAAKSLGWKTASFSAAYEGRADRIAAVVRKQGKPPRAIFHRGAFGIEPVMYVLGETAVEVAREACALAAAAEASR